MPEVVVDVDRDDGLGRDGDDWPVEDYGDVGTELRRVVVREQRIRCGEHRDGVADDVSSTSPSETKPVVGVMTAEPSMYAVASHWTVETPMLKSAMMLVKPTLRNVSLNVAINAASAAANIMDSGRFSAA